jgi:hypothetical protein
VKQYISCYLCLINILYLHRMLSNKPVVVLSWWYPLWNMIIIIYVGSLLIFLHVHIYSLLCMCLDSMHQTAFNAKICILQLVEIYPIRFGVTNNFSKDRSYQLSLCDRLISRPQKGLLVKIRSHGFKPILLTCVAFWTKWIIFSTFNIILWNLVDLIIQIV